MIVEIAAWIVGAVATLVASACAAADSALLVSHVSETATVWDAEFADRERDHRALSMARVLAYVVAGAAFAQALRLPLASFPVRFFAIVIAAMLVCIVAEGMGPAIGEADAEASVPRFEPLTRFVSVILSPAVTLGQLIDRALHVVIPPAPPDDEDRETSAEQFREVVAAEAEVSSAEEELIHGVFSLGETEVQEIMVPRVDMVGIEAETPWSETLDRIRSSEHARLPVFRETIDDIVGILYAKDVLPAIVADEEPTNGWGSLVRRATFIPVSKRIDAQLREFQASRTHIAIVSDEYGGTAGLITIEDILEEIVGEIRDEYDVEEPPIEQQGADRFWVSGNVPIDELAERLETDFGVEDVATVGGLVYALFRRVPRSGEWLAHSGFRVVVERVRRRRIERVYFERLEARHAAEIE
ncbi:MAG TPA: hemolysin family protein [Gemmatimonadaceae bacterium]|jgi:CBS domain containing-hemolysin-like protein|nr:hemolysin family protein [Gemmatimonadaceae bacterium]